MKPKTNDTAGSLPQGDWLDAALYAAAPPAVADDGFSQRVLAQLPFVPAVPTAAWVDLQLRRERIQSRRYDFGIALACLLGTGVAFVGLGWPDAAAMERAAWALAQWPPVAWRQSLPLLSAALACAVLSTALLRERGV